MKKKFSVSTLACCDKQVPTRLRQSAHWFFTLVGIYVLMATTGCQTYPIAADPELAHVVFPTNAPAQPQIKNQNRRANQAVASPTISSSYPTRFARAVDAQPQQPRTHFNSARDSNVQHASYQYPATQPAPSFQAPGTGPVIGFQPHPTSSQTNPPAYQAAPNFNSGQLVLPVINTPVIADIDVTMPRGPTGRASIGATYGSNNGLVGQFIIDERDFDILNWPRPQTGGFQRNTWRGGGQTFRAEMVPGTELQRYLVSLANPYFRGTEYSLSVSGYYFDRQYTDWDEQRAGGRISVGRALNKFLSLNTSLRMESVMLDDPRVITSPELNAHLGNSNLFLGSIGLEYDTRINPCDCQPDPFLTAQGSYLALTFKQAFGDYSYSRGELDYRRHRMIYARPDGSGRHTIGFKTKLGFSGSSTPVFETFLGGGVSSLRGFEFRGVSPIDGGVRVGGDFQWLNSLEYMFPLTADDMVAGVMFFDFGTVEESIKLNSENYRAAPGLGLRVNLPFAGLGAPLAFDWAFPVATATGDLEQHFSFLVGLLR